MNIKIICHIMPWEIDYAFMSFTQLKKTYFYIPDDVEIRTEIHSNNDGELDATLLYDYNSDLIGQISRAYYDRNPEYNTLWIEKGYADKFVDSLTIYVPFDRTIREDYVKNYFQFEYAHMGKKILFINSRDGY